MRHVKKIISMMMHTIGVHILMMWIVETDPVKMLIIVQLQQQFQQQPSFQPRPSSQGSFNQAPVFRPQVSTGSQVRNPAPAAQSSPSFSSSSNRWLITKSYHIISYTYDNEMKNLDSSIGIENLRVKLSGTALKYLLVHASRVGSQCLVSGVSLATAKIFKFE